MKGSLEKAFELNTPTDGGKARDKFFISSSKLVDTFLIFLCPTWHHSFLFYFNP